MSARVVAGVLCVALTSLGCGADDDPMTGVGGAGGVAGAAGMGGMGGEGAAGGGGGAGGAAPRDCWAEDITTWDSVEAFDLASLGEDARDPALSADGLTLFYAARAGATAPARIYRSVRTSSTAAFTPGEQVADWMGYQPVGHPWVVGSQMVLTYDEGGGAFRLATSIFDGSVWSFPVAFGSLINDLQNSQANSNAAFTEDAARMLFVRSNPGFDLKLYEAVRSTGTPFEPFATVAPVVIPGLEMDDASVCPAVSPDGLHMLFSTSYPNDISGGMVPEGAVTVWYTTRSDLDAAWEIPIHLAAFDDPVFQSCVYAVSGDGCEVWVERFELGSSASPGFVIGRR